MTYPTEIDAAAIRARLEAATPGPWRVEDYNRDGHAPLVVGDDMAVAETFDKPHLADAEFIAHARTDVERLLAALDEARAEVERLHFDLDREAHARQAAEREVVLLREGVDERARVIRVLDARVVEIAEVAESRGYAAQEQRDRAEAAESALAAVLKVADEWDPAIWYTRQLRAALATPDKPEGVDRQAGLTIHEVGKQVAAAYQQGLADARRNDEPALAAVQALADEWRRDGRDRGLAGMSLTRTEAARLLTAALATPTTPEETQP